MHVPAGVGTSVVQAVAVLAPPGQPGTPVPAAGTGHRAARARGQAQHRSARLAGSDRAARPAALVIPARTAGAPAQVTVFNYPAASGSHQTSRGIG